jgi:PST family polysaccharide transporter
MNQPENTELGPRLPPHDVNDLGDRARSGSAWIIIATGAAKSVGFITQFALAWFLSRREFGVFAIAVSLSVMLSVLRDGGLPMVLIERGRRFDYFAGPVFWMMLAINLVTGSIILLAAEPTARSYQIPELASVIALFAINIPLCVPSALLSLRLNVDMRFKELGVIQLISAVLRNGLTLYFAWAGYGARSFLLPLLVTNVTDAIMLWSVTRFYPWLSPARFHLWPELFRSGRWVILGTFAIALGNNGAYLLLGKLLPSDVLGTYFFAYQLVMQLGIVLSDNVYQVLFAAFVRMHADIPRIRSAVLRSLNVVVLIGATASLSIAAVYEPLERGLWHGKWASATTTIYILGLVWPAAAGVSVLRALQAAGGRFNQWGIITLCNSIVTVAGTVVGAYVTGTSFGAALGFALGAMLGAWLNARYALAAIHINLRKALVVVMRPWLVMALAAVGAKAATQHVSGALLQLLVTLLLLFVFAYGGLLLFSRDSLNLLLMSVRQVLGTKRINQLPFLRKS